MFPLINLSSVLMFELEAGCCTGAVCRSHSGKMINDRLVYVQRVSQSLKKLKQVFGHMHKIWLFHYLKVI